MVSRMRSWLASTTSTPSRRPARTKRRARRTATSCVDRVAGLRGGAHGRNGQRPAADGDDLEEPPRVVGQARDARGQHLFERDRRRGRGTCRPAPIAEVRAGAARELLDQERAPARLARDGVGRLRAPRRRRSRGATSARRRASSGVERSDGHVAHLGVLPASASRRSARNGLVSASSARCVITSRSGGASGGRIELEEERGAVGVAPLHVVDEDDHAAAAARAPRAARAARSNARWRTHLRDRRRRLARSSPMPGTRRSTGKTCASAQMSPGQRRGLAAVVERRIRWRLKRVDHAVDRLEGHRLALVRAAPQDERRRRAARARRGSVHDGRLADAREAADADGDGAPLARRLERVAQRRAACASRRRAPSSRGSSLDHGAPAPGRSPSAPRRRRISSQSGRLSGVRSEQRDAERVEVLGARPSTQRRRRGGSTVHFSVRTSTAEPTNGGRPTRAS